MAATQPIVSGDSGPGTVTARLDDTVSESKPVEFDVDIDDDDLEIGLGGTTVGTGTVSGGVTGGTGGTS